MTTKNAAYYESLGLTNTGKPKSGWQLTAWNKGYEQHLVATGRTVTAKIDAAKNAPRLVSTVAYGHRLSGTKHFERQMRKSIALVSQIQHRQRLRACA